MKQLTTRQACNELGIFRSVFFQSAKKIGISSDFVKDKNAYWSEEKINKIKEYRSNLYKRVSNEDKLLIIERFLTLNNNSVPECIKGTSVCVDYGAKIIGKYLKDKFIILESKINR